MAKIVNTSNAASPDQRRLKWRPAMDGRGGMLEVQQQAPDSDVWNTVASVRMSSSQTSLLMDAIAPNALAAYRVALANAGVSR